MRELIDKRNEYLNQIEEIKKHIAEEVEKFKAQKELELEKVVKEYEQQFLNDAQEKISLLTKRIDLLDVMIREEMPEATKINEAVTCEKEIDIQPTTEMVREAEMEPVEQEIEIIEDNDDFLVVPQNIPEEPKEVVLENEEPQVIEEYVAPSVGRPGMPEIVNPR